MANFNGLTKVPYNVSLYQSSGKKHGCQRSCQIIAKQEIREYPIVENFKEVSVSTNKKVNKREFIYKLFKTIYLQNTCILAKTILKLFIR